MTTPTVVPFPWWRQARGFLAERQLNYSALAEASGVHVTTVTRVLSGSQLPGQLVRIKLVRGLRKLGLELPAGVEFE